MTDRDAFASMDPTRGLPGSVPRAVDASGARAPRPDECRNPTELQNLIDRSVAGDETARAALHAMFSPRLRGYIRAAYGSEIFEFADDLIQMTWTHALRLLPRYDCSKAQFYYWLKKSPVRSAYKDLRRQAVREVPMDDIPEPIALETEEVNAALHELFNAPTTAEIELRALRFLSSFCCFFDCAQPPHYILIFCFNVLFDDSYDTIRSVYGRKTVQELAELTELTFIEEWRLPGGTVRRCMQPFRVRLEHPLGTIVHGKASTLYSSDERKTALGTLTLADLYKDDPQRMHNWRYRASSCWSVDSNKGAVE